MGGAGNDWLPENFRVTKEDKSLDLEASAKKVVGSYSELSKRMKDVGLPPESHDKYEITAAVEADKELLGKLVLDPGAQKFLKDAHGKSFSNAQMNVAMNFALDLAKNIGTSVLNETKDECIAELAKLPGGQAGVAKLLATGKRAAVAFGGAVGITFDEVEAAGLANNPIFARLMAAVGAEMAEDLPAPGDAGGGAGKPFEEQAAELRAELDKLELHDPKRKGVQEKLDGLYNRKFPAGKPVFKGAA